MFKPRKSDIGWRERCPYWLILGGGLAVALILLVVVPSSAWANPTTGLSGQTVPPPTEPPTVPPTAPPPTPPPPPTPTRERFPEPSPTPTEERKKRPDEPCAGEIRGVVTDDCIGQVVAGAQVQIDGAVVTTDSQGHYSISGLLPGQYTVQLLVPDAPPPVTVNLECDQVAIVDLHYNPCAPAVTPAAPELLPVTGSGDDLE